jgi:hypothetical protein
LENDQKNTKYYASGIKLPRQNNYEIAYKEAVEEFLKRDISEICFNTGASMDENKQNIIISFLNRDIIVTFPGVRIFYKNNEDVPLWLKILLLHYLSDANGIPASGKQITFKEISGGLAYYPTFQNRAVNPVLSTFAGRYDDFIQSAERIGGIRSGYSSYSITFRVFPNISITFNIWEGDEDFPPEGNVIFDSSITNYLCTEDIVMMCNMIAVMIIKSKGN